LERAKFFDDGSDGVFAANLDDFAAFELVWVDVSYQFAQSVEVRAARDGLIVLFYERQGQVSLSRVKC
jgi:hypothetical protein